MSVENHLKTCIKKTVMTQLRTERGKHVQTTENMAKVPNTSPSVIDVAELHGRISWKMLNRWLSFYNKWIAVELKDRK